MFIGILAFRAPGIGGAQRNNSSGQPIAKNSLFAARFADELWLWYWRAMSVASESDLERLLGLARKGDVVALGRLLEQYRTYLGLLARLQLSRRLQRKVDAADLVQETFLKAARDFASFRGDTTEELAHWLREILACSTANLVRHYLGTRRRDQRLERELAAELDQSSRALDGGLLAGGSSPSQRAVRREQALLLADALNQLPDDYREVLILRHLEELSFPDVASRMGRSLDSVKNLWTRALARLRRTVKGAM
jgi:RNA polymerase sigma-70 factor (ECF subfamily)